MPRIRKIPRPGYETVEEALNFKIWLGRIPSVFPTFNYDVEQHFFQSDLSKTVLTPERS